MPAALAAVLLVASQLSAQTQPAPAPATPPDVVEVKPAAPKPVPKPPAKKVEEPKIPGYNITRANGTFLGLEVIGGNFKLSFYDKKKKAMAPDVLRGTARWPNVRGPGDNRTVLNPNGTALTGSKPVIPPFTFNVYLTLMQKEGEEEKSVESYVVPFRG